MAGLAASAWIAIPAGAVLAAPVATASPASLASPPSLAGFLPMDDDAASFNVLYAVQQDGSMRVTQRIRWDFPEGEERHGIYRTIQTRAGYQESTTQYRHYELSDVEVTSPTGAPTDTDISDFGAYEQVRIGSADETVEGVQEYVLSYTLANVINDIGDGTAELYYNHIDPSNEYVYRNVTADVTGPVPATQVACYYGALQEDTKCTGTAGATSSFQVPDISPGQGATIVVSWPRTAFGDLTPDLRETGDDGSFGGGYDPGPSLSDTQSRYLGAALAGGGVLLPLLAGGLMGLLVWTRGRDEVYAGLTPGLTPGAGESAPVVRGKAPTVAVQFNPPPGVQPGMVGTIMDEKADVVDVTATLIDLAVRGHLTLTNEERGRFRSDDWLLRRQTPPAGGAALAPYEQRLLDGVFAKGDETRLSELKNTFAGTLKQVQGMMYTESVQRHWFRRSPDAQRAGWVGLGFTLMGLGGFALFFGTAGLGSLGGGGLVAKGWVFGIGLIVTGIIVQLLGRSMASRTAEGSAVLAQSQGFERYIATAEANQIRWEEAQDVFSKFLPYAIVFGLADRWAAVFEEVAAAAAAAGQSIAAPLWYAGPITGWNFGHVASSMDSFSTQAAGTFVSTPGSSGGSGLGGGGFSGGGGGGSW